jgi:hypothetical protein
VRCSGLEQEHLSGWFGCEQARLSFKAELRMRSVVPLVQDGVALLQGRERRSHRFNEPWICTRWTPSRSFS